MTAVVLLWAAVQPSRVRAQSGGIENRILAAAHNQPTTPRLPQDSQNSRVYEGKTVVAIDLPGLPAADLEHLLKLLPQPVGSPLSERDRVRDSIKVLYGTGRFADIQAEVAPSGNGVVLTFVPRRISLSAEWRSRARPPPNRQPDRERFQVPIGRTVQPRNLTAHWRISGSRCRRTASTGQE